ncbi:MAG: DUF1501 domain-containing protein [Planctomyces sp.]|nr:DUF1501 domain-containing protein [Planctomyces sp.]
MLHRRDALLRLGSGLGGLSLPGLLQAASRQQASDAPAATARSCILIYLWGGPPQMDLWDPKPDAPDGIRSPFGTIATAVPGIHFTDQIPGMARHADKLAVIRSYTHDSNQHEVGVYHTLTGHIDNTLAVPRNRRSRRDFPNLPAVVARFSPPALMPASVTVPRPIGHDGVVYTGTWAGFLGPQFDAVELQSPGEVDAPPPHALELPPSLSQGRLQLRHGLLSVLEHADRTAQSARFERTAARSGMNRFREQAFAMLTAPETKSAFDIDREPAAIRDAYGRNEYGEAILLARRLIESGVRIVTMVWQHICPDGNVANVWDNHGGTSSLGGLTGYEMLKQPYCLPSLDRATAALLDDLSQRGLLDETLVLMLGEFGRTPKINATAGRDHWGPCQSVVLAGGGIRGGQVYGASDASAAYPVRDPVRPEDFIATACQALGVPPDATITDESGRPHRVSEGRVIQSLFG